MKSSIEIKSKVINNNGNEDEFGFSIPTKVMLNAVVDSIETKILLKLIKERLYRNAQRTYDKEYVKDLHEKDLKDFLELVKI